MTPHSNLSENFIRGSQCMVKFHMKVFDTYTHLLIHILSNYVIFIPDSFLEWLVLAMLSLWLTENPLYRYIKTGSWSLFEKRSFSDKKFRLVAAIKKPVFHEYSRKITKLSWDTYLQNRLKKRDTVLQFGSHQWIQGYFRKKHFVDFLGKFLS